MFFPVLKKRKNGLEPSITILLSRDTLDDPSSRVSVPNETEDLNLHVFNMITGINESKTLAKQISCKRECQFDGRKRNLNQRWNNDKVRCECKNPKENRVCEKVYNWNPATCSSENGKYMGSIIGDSVITCDKIIEKTKKYIYIFKFYLYYYIYISTSIF